MTLAVAVDGVSISGTLLDSASVLKKERSAAIAKFSYHIASTPTLPDALIGRPVNVDWSGSRLFTGSVNSADWDPYRRVYSVTCSDLLQESFEGKTDAEILALIPGARYSANIHGAREDGWQYALDCMSTVLLDVHKDCDGVLRTPAYAAKGTADLVLTGAQIVNDGEYKLVLARRRDLVTRQRIKYEYRVSRWKQRSHSYAWHGMNAAILGHAGGWCEWYRSNRRFALPTREQITSAAEGTGWAVDGAIHFETHPDAFAPEDGVCGGGSAWNPFETQQSEAISAYWSALRSWAQTVSETYEITLEVPPAQTSFGVSEHEDAAAYQVDSDDGAMESGVQPDATGWATDSLDDVFEDQDDESVRDNDIQTLIAMGVTRISQALRGSSVTVSAEILPALALADTVEIDTADIQARGKVNSIEHSISDRGAFTAVGIAISRGGAGAGDTLTTPARPDTAPTHPAPDSSTLIQTHVGLHHTVPDYDPDWETENGFVTNIFGYICSPPNCPTAEQRYDPEAFRVLGGDIETEARDEVTATRTASYNVSVPQDLLVLL